jgi:hypothetical protein
MANYLELMTVGLMPEEYSSAISFRPTKQEARELGDAVNVYGRKKSEIIRHALKLYLAEVRREGKMTIYPHSPKESKKP